MSLTLPDELSIAIVGYSGVFPGATDLDAFWRLIVDGRDNSSEPPPGRWALDAEEVIGSDVAPDRVYTTRGYFAESSFDRTLDEIARHGNLDRQRLAGLDPVYHLLLAAGWAAWHSCSRRDVETARAGTILGSIALPTDAASRWGEQVLLPAMEAGLFLGEPVAGFSSRPRTDPLNRFVTGLPATLLAQALGLGGESYTLDAACASSLFAVKLACDALRDGRADVMLAGGLSRPDALYTQMGFCQLRALSPSGRCAPLDAKADGLLVGEGAGVVVLKRLEDAIEQGETIHAVIRGIGWSNDIGGNLMAPDSEGQLRAMRAAYRQAGWRPSDVDYVECHGTGTPLGDQVELASLETLWSEDDAGQRNCVIGSVKSNVGHLLTGAGAAGLIRVLLALRHATFPPTANFERMPDQAATGDRHLRPLAEPEAWSTRDEQAPRRGAVSAFGFGGTNAHLLLEQWEAPSHAASSAGEFGSVRPTARDEAHSSTDAAAAIAIVGLGVKLGSADSVEAFARQTRSGEARDARQPRCWWNLPEQAKWRGHLLEEIEFDAERFRIPPTTVREILPQQLVMLEAADEALSQIGIEPGGQGLSSAGVFVGIQLDMHTTGYHFRWQMAERARDWAKQLGLELTSEELDRWIAELREAAGPPLSAERTMGGLGSIVASRLARAFRVGGPSFTVAGGEASGLRALGLAAEALRRGEIDLAIVGAVDMAGDVRHVLAVAGVESQPVRPYLLGEGAAAIVLQRRGDAEREGNRISAILGDVRTWRGGDPLPNQQTNDDRFSSLRGEFRRNLPVDPSQLETMELVGTVGMADSISSNGFATPTSRIEDAIGHAGAANGLAAAVRAVIRLNDAAAESGRQSGADDPKQQKCHTGVLAGSIDGTRSLVWLEAPLQVDQSLAKSDAARLRVKDDASITAKAAKRGTLVRLDLRRGAFDVSLPQISKPPAELAEPVAASSSRSAGIVAATHATPEREPDLAPRAFSEAPAHVPSSVASANLLQPIVAQAARTAEAEGAAHAAFLQFTGQTEQFIRSLAMPQADRVSSWDSSGGQVGAKADEAANDEDVAVDARPVVMDRRQCLEFAVGSIAASLGPEFAEVDQHPTRVRLPDEPLMLVDRVTELDARPRSLRPGRLVTEHDVRADAWYLDAGRMVTGVAIESGQADLLLSAYLGIDFQTRGLAMYRLLDAAVDVYRELPRPGETIQYDIRIKQFFRQGDMHLFRFEFDATIDGQPLLSMRDGCAGFFTPAELAAGQGIVQTALERQKQAGKLPVGWRPPVSMRRESLDERAVEALRAGDLMAAFGSEFADLRLARPLTLPGGRLHLLRRVIEIDPAGGRYGIGRIVAEADIAPDDWYLTCHFVDDQVMPGTLMYECALATLRIFMLRLGWIGEDDGSLVYEPLPGVTSRLKCRGQVTAETRRVQYEVSIKELGYTAEEGTPYAIADALMYADGRPIVAMNDMTLSASGLTAEWVESLWSHATGETRPDVLAAARSEPVLFDRASLEEFAVGQPSQAFGERYAAFDRQRFIARLPAPPFLLIDRVTSIRDCEAWELLTGAKAVTAYDVPRDAWYFRDARGSRMPLSVLMEVALQSCGWLAAYLGSALRSDADLAFRNLGGQATQLRQVTPESGTLTTHVELTKVTDSAGMILEHFRFEVQDLESQPVYTGETYFGFFTREALAAQAGIRDARIERPSEGETTSRASYRHHASLPSGMLRMLDRIEFLLPEGGPADLGWIEGSADVDPSAWFFKAHFYQDPVWPGSLGLESFVELLKVFSLHVWPAEADADRTYELLAEPSHQWQYRGQVLPTHRKVIVQANITARDDRLKTLVADGWLAVDGRVIYQMQGFSLRAVDR